jgi:hypothetical protein
MITLNECPNELAMIRAGEQETYYPCPICDSKDNDCQYCAGELLSERYYNELMREITAQRDADNLLDYIREND